MPNRDRDKTGQTGPETAPHFGPATDLKEQRRRWPGAFAHFLYCCQCDEPLRKQMTKEGNTEKWSWHNARCPVHQFGYLVQQNEQLRAEMERLRNPPEHRAHSNWQRRIHDLRTLYHHDGVALPDLAALDLDWLEEYLEKLTNPPRPTCTGLQFCDAGDGGRHDPGCPVRYWQELRKGSGMDDLNAKIHAERVRLGYYTQNWLQWVSGACTISLLNELAEAGLAPSIYGPGCSSERWDVAWGPDGPDDDWEMNSADTAPEAVALAWLAAAEAGTLEKTDA